MVSTLFLLACVPEASVPWASVAAPTVEHLDFTRVDLGFPVAISGEPGDVRLELTVNGGYAVPVDLVALDDGLRIPASLDLAAVIAAGVVAEGEDTAPYVLLGEIDVDASTVPVRLEGVLAVPRPPEITLRGLTIGASDSGRADGWLAVEVANPMTADVVVGNASARLDLDAGTAAIGGGFGAVGGGAATTARIPLVVDLVTDAWLVDGEILAARFTATVQVDTPFGLLPHEVLVDGPLPVSCDGGVTLYADLDDDGFGDPDAGLPGACAAGGQYVNNALDCDDTDSETSPDAREVLRNEADDDCDPTTSDADYDADGASADDDCDDRDPRAFPGAAERCNEVDDDCDGEVDEGEALGAATWFRDADADGWGKAALSQRSCTPLEGFVARSGDCDDARADVYPAAVDKCDGIDSACDGGVEADVDGDKHLGCADCDDRDKSTFPGAPEGCTAIDRNCDGKVAADLDGDGFLTCADCDDNDPDAFPGAVELCNGVDDNCDGKGDAGAVDPTKWYADVDKDGFGAASVTACVRPAGYVTVGGDCDDGAALVNPRGVEVCNGRDDDCDGRIDVGATDRVSGYVDADRDGYGAGAATLGCPAAGFSGKQGDCDDGDPLANPAGIEDCNGRDDDCDGARDEGLTDVGANKICAGSWWWFDDEGSPGFGTVEAGAPPPEGSGVGSARLWLTGPVGTVQKMRFGTGAYAGLALADLDAITFWAKRNLGSPTFYLTFQFRVDYDPSDGRIEDGRFWTYEPTLDGSNPGNAWFAVRPLDGSIPGRRWWRAGVLSDSTSTLCKIANPCTWAEIIAAFPATAILDEPLKSGVSVKAGGWSNVFDSNVDRVEITVGTVKTVHDFEP